MVKKHFAMMVVENTVVGICLGRNKQHSEEVLTDKEGKLDIEIVRRKYHACKN